MTVVEREPADRLWVVSGSTPGRREERIVWAKTVEEALEGSGIGPWADVFYMRTLDRGPPMLAHT